MDKKVSNIPSGVELEILRFYLPDYTAKLHVREISRLLNVSHRTVSLALKRLESKGVMRHETVGKNKQYFLNLRNFLTKEYLKNAESLPTMKLIEKHFIIRKLLTELSTDMKNTPIILFGSYAKGEETKESDIDVLIIKDHKEKKIINKINGFARLHNIRIHIQKSTQWRFEAGMKEKDHLVVEIMNNHVVLNNIELFVDMLWRHFCAR